jgi:uncharacterized protein HemX
MAKKRKKAAKPAAKMPAKKAVHSKPAQTSGYSADTTVNALVILVVIIIAIGAAYMYLQKAKAGPAPIDVSPMSLLIAPQ